MHYYVIYSPTAGYLDDNYDPVPYDRAARFTNSCGPVADTILRNVRHWLRDARWVGPCIETEEP